MWLDLRVRENSLFKKSQQEKWELNQSSYTGNVKKTDEKNIVEIKSICFEDWIEIGEAKAGEKKVNDRFGITILGAQEL